MSSRNLRGVGLDSDAIVENARIIWERDNDAYSGLEFIHAANMFGRGEAAENVARILLARGELRPESETLIRRVIAAPKSQADDPRANIREAKKSLSSYPRNPMLRTQLALAYATQGQKDKAIGEMAIALSLAPENRNVVRSATRLLVHSGKQDQALHMLKRFKDSSDPWILSALVATADLLNDRSAISPRKLRSFLESGLPPYQLIELAAALATIEVGSGNNKRAKKIMSPQLPWINENVAAQLRWLDRNHGVSFDIDFSRVAGSFEVDSLEHFYDRRYEAALASARLWHLDEAFATRAAIHASYVASTYAGRPDVALSFLDPAILANPSNPTLHNNRAFALSELGEFSQATAALDLAVSLSPKDIPDPVLMATRANIAIRSGDALEGGFLYVDALEEARKQKLVEVEARIGIHFLKEIIDLGYELAEEDREKLRRNYTAAKGLPAEIRDLYEVLVEGRLAAAREVQGSAREKIKLSVDDGSSNDNEPMYKLVFGSR